MKISALVLLLTAVSLVAADADTQESLEPKRSVPEAIRRVFDGTVERRGKPSHANSPDQRPTPGPPKMSPAERKKYHPNEASNYALVKKFWDNFMFPKNRVVVSSHDSGNILADDVRGRVDITRSFSGKELNIEYLFGTFAAYVPAAQFQFVALPVNYSIVQFASTDNTASQSVVLDLKDQLTGAMTKIQIDAWTQYNSKGQIQQYDAVFRRYPFYWLDAIDSKAPALYAGYKKMTNVDLAPSRANTLLAVQNLLAYSICQSHTTNCVGPLAQYASQAECFQFLTRSVPLGEPFMAGHDNLLCRAIHQQMLSIRPEEHCPHIGKTGGGMCINTPYTDNFLPFYENSWNIYEQ